MLVAYFVEPLFDTKEIYIFGKSLGNQQQNNLKFNSPFGIALDSKDNLYVTDTFNQRIKQFIFSEYTQLKFCK